MIRIGIDAMGGDFAPENIILGAIEAYTRIGDNTKICLIGNEVKITEVCNHYGFDSGNFILINATQVIEMGEHPVRTYRKKPDSSIHVGYDMLSSGKIDAFASAGNTGAMLTGAVNSLSLLPGIIRPCISAQIPLSDGKNMLILDVGFNSDSKADILYQFGILGSIYANVMMGVNNPKVALLNIGTEDEKGNLVTKEAYKLMNNSIDFEFVGNMEANKMFTGGIADVLVTDGFVGNICLKQAEGMYELVNKLGVDHPFMQRFNYENYGGTPVLGVSSPIVIGHGASTPVAIKNMILEAEKAVKTDLIKKLSKSINKKCFKDE